jgi:hypothetical protein
VNGTKPLHLWVPDDPPTNQITRQSTMYAVANWSVTEHNALTEQDEPYYDIRMDKKRVARAMPWHGYYSQVQGVGMGLGPAKHMCPTPEGVLFLIIGKRS